MRTMRSLLLIALSVLTVGCLAQEAPIFVTGFETLDGLSLGFDAKNPASKLSLNQDANFVSEGAASLLLQSVSPEGTTGNTYLAVSVALPEPISLNKRALVFDAWTTEVENTRALYVRGYDSANECALSWQSWGSPVVAGKRTEVELIPRIPSGGLAWEPKMAVSPDREEIVRLEFIIGAHEHGVPYNIYLDNVRLVASEVTPFMEITNVKPLCLDTPLVEDGKPSAMILCPEAEAWKQAAAELQSALKGKLGVELPIRAAEQLTDEDLKSTQVIALGCVSNNPRLLYVYSHSYTHADDLYPGADGYILQSIHDPWGTGKNVVLVGASTVEGAKLAFPQLLDRLSDAGIVPQVFKVSLAGLARQRFQTAFDREPDEAYQESQHKAAEDRLEKGAHTGLFGQLSSVGAEYAQTRKDGYAELFAWLVRRAKEHHDTDPGTYGGPWGMDSDFQIYKVLPAWDVVEESPALSEQDRLEVTRILFQWVSDVGVGPAQGTVGSTRVRHNHQTFPALGLLFAGEYFDKYYKAAEARRWLDIADAAFQFQAKAFKPYEDCNGYQWLTLYHTMLYSLARPDFTFFENGNARRCADFAILCMDNLGYQVTYGDTGAFTGWWSEMPFLRGALWHYRDARYAWAIEKKFAVSGRLSMGEYNTDSPEDAPQDLIGAIAWPLDPHYYASFGGPELLPEERAVDKVVFRNGFDPEDQYLLLDGLSNGGHKHLDGNSISRWSENGRIWLADADYILSLPKYHNGVLIFRDGQSQRIPDFVELEHIVDLPSFGASTTTYPNYAGVDWRRNIVWLKDKCFLVADEMVATQDGDYSFRIVWNTIGEVELTDAGLSIHQDGQYAAIAVTSDCRLTLEDDPAYGKNWGGYKHIKEPVVRVFQAIRNCSLKAGEQVTLFSVLHASGENASPARLVRIDENTIAVAGLDEPIMLAVGGPAGEFGGAGELRIKGALGVATPTRLCFVGASEIAGLGQAMQFEGGADLEVDLENGRTSIVTPAGATAQADRNVQERELAAFRLPADEVRGALEAIIAAAPPGVRPAAGGVAIPKDMQTLWTYREKLDAYLLTDNARAFEAVDVGVRMSASPEPLAENVFARQPGQNTVDNLLDGQLLTTDGGVMWDDDRPVTINLEFDNEYDITKVVLKEWFATSSSKNKLFQLGELVVEASNDGFGADVRKVAKLSDTEERGNWGAPGYGPHPYELLLADVKARALRLRLEPRPGTAIYIAELEVWGNRPGLEIDYETLRKRAVPVHTFKAVSLADLDGDGTDEIIAGSTNGKVCVLNGEGETLWKIETGGAVNSVATVDFNGDGKPAVVAGSMGATATAISPAGEKLWTFEAPYYKRAAHVRVVFPADLNGDGKQVAIIGADNWHFYAIDRDGEELWRYESVHGSTCGAAADVDGDGKDEVVAGTEYYWWHVVKPDGERLFSYSTRGGPHANAATTANLDGDNTRCVIFAGADANVHAIGPDGKLRWLFNTGDEVTAVAAMDINGDGRDEILAASMSFNVYAIDATGKMIWRQDVGSAVTSLISVPAPEGPRVLIGCKDGGLCLFDAGDGKLLAGSALGAPVVTLAEGSAGANTPVVAAASEAGDLFLLALDAER